MAMLVEFDGRRAVMCSNGKKGVARLSTPVYSDVAWVHWKRIAKRMPAVNMFYDLYFGNSVYRICLFPFSSR